MSSMTYTCGEGKGPITAGTGILSVLGQHMQVAIPTVMVCRDQLPGPGPDLASHQQQHCHCLLENVTVNVQTWLILSNDKSCLL